MALLEKWAKSRANLSVQFFPFSETTPISANHEGAAGAKFGKNRGQTQCLVDMLQFPLIYLVVYSLFVIKCKLISNL